MKSSRAVPWARSSASLSHAARSADGSRASAWTRPCPAPLCGDVRDPNRQRAELRKGAAAAQDAPQPRDRPALDPLRWLFDATSFTVLPDVHAARIDRNRAVLITPKEFNGRASNSARAQDAIFQVVGLLHVSVAP